MTTIDTPFAPDHDPYQPWDRSWEQSWDQGQQPPPQYRADYVPHTYGRAARSQFVAHRPPAAAAQPALRTYGLLAQVATLVATACTAWYGLTAGRLVGVVDDLQGGVSIGRAQADVDTRALTVAVLALAGAGVVAFVLFAAWFWRVRRTAGSYRPGGQRRAQAWAFWGLICPIASLFVPAQIAVDAMRSTPGGPGRVWLVRAWWLAVVSTSLVGGAARSTGTDTLGAIHTTLILQVTTCALGIVTGVLAVAVIAVLTGALDRRGALSA